MRGWEKRMHACGGVEVGQGDGDGEGGGRNGGGGGRGGMSRG